MMTNNDNVESSLLTSSLLKICCIVQVDAMCTYTRDQVTTTTQTSKIIIDARSVIKDIYHSISLSSYVITWLSEVGI